MGKKSCSSAWGKSLVDERAQKRMSRLVWAGRKTTSQTITLNKCGELKSITECTKYLTVRLNYWTCSAYPRDAVLSEFGGQVNTFSCPENHSGIISRAFYSMLSCLKGQLPLGNTVAIKGWARFAAMCVTDTRAQNLNH